MTSILGFLRDQIASVDTPLMKAAHAAQDFFAHVTGNDDVAPIGEADSHAARTQANRTLAQIDFSKRDIVLWVPATGSHEVPEGWEKAVHGAWGNSAPKPVLLDYPASIDFTNSVPTGMEALRNTLDGIAAHGGKHRVLLAGHSQGAWVISDAMRDPAVSAKVSKAVVYGLPAESQTAVDKGASHPKLTIVNNPDDPFTTPTAATAAGFEGVSELKNHKFSWRSALKIGGAALLNPFLAAYLIGREFSHEDWSGSKDPHHYNSDFAAGAQRLRTGA